MKNNEIINILEHCIKSECYKCEKTWNDEHIRPCMQHLMVESLNFINRQQAEIEDLKKGLDIWKDIAHRETRYVDIAKAVGKGVTTMKKYNMIISKNDSGKRIANTEFWYNRLLEIFKDTARYGLIRINNVSIRFEWYSFSSDKEVLFLTDDKGKGIAIIHLDQITSVE